MAHYYASIQGTRGEATRCGDKKSGIHGHIRGWNIGASVHISYNEETGQDIVSIRLTSGSNSRKPGKCLGDYTIDDLEKEITVSKKLIKEEA